MRTAAGAVVTRGPSPLSVVVMVGLLLALPGALAVLAGLTAMRRVRRLRRNGVATWAMSVPLAQPGDRQPDDQQSAGSSRRQLLQYKLADGRVLEHVTAAPARRSASLRPGQPVLVWYDPADPTDVLVYGRWGRSVDRAFVAIGALFILIGAWLAVSGH
jgi:hypothetical protein